jgi:hypothetical protein
MKKIVLPNVPHSVGAHALPYKKYGNILQHPSAQTRRQQYLFPPLLPENQQTGQIGR